METGGESIQLEFEKLRARLEFEKADVRDTGIRRDEDKLKAIKETLDDVKARIETREDLLDGGLNVDRIRVTPPRTKDGD